MGLVRLAKGSKSIFADCSSAEETAGAADASIDFSGVPLLAMETNDPPADEAETETLTALLAQMENIMPNKLSKGLKDIPSGSGRSGAEPAADLEPKNLRPIEQFVAAGETVQLTADDTRELLKPFQNQAGTTPKKPRRAEPDQSGRPESLRHRDASALTDALHTEFQDPALTKMLKSQGPTLDRSAMALAQSPYLSRAAEAGGILPGGAIASKPKLLKAAAEVNGMSLRYLSRARGEMPRLLGFRRSARKAQ